MTAAPACLIPPNGAHRPEVPPPPAPPPWPRGAVGYPGPGLAARPSPGWSAPDSCVAGEMQRVVNGRTGSRIWLAAMPPAGSLSAAAASVSGGMASRPSRAAWRHGANRNLSGAGGQRLEAWARAGPVGAHPTLQPEAEGRRRCAGPNRRKRRAGQRISPQADISAPKLVDHEQRMASRRRRSHRRQGRRSAGPGGQGEEGASAHHTFVSPLAARHLAIPRLAPVRRAAGASRRAPRR